MNRLYNILCLITILSLPLHAQMQQVKDIANVQQKIAQVAKDVKSIECDFVQTKHLEIFNEDIISKGQFYYRAEDKICLNYTNPLPYLMVINGEKIKIVSDGKKNIMNLKSNKVMKEMRGMLTGCMSGNLSDVKGYQMVFFEDQKFYLIKVKPTNKDIMAYITQFDIYMEKSDMSVSKLRITEAGSNYTDYQFSNKKFNTLNDDSKFSIL